MTLSKHHDEYWFYKFIVELKEKGFSDSEILERVMLELWRMMKGTYDV